jgi:hypothetical protein
MAVTVPSFGVIPDLVPGDQSGEAERYADKLKRAYLFFDGLVIPSLEETISTAPAPLAADLEWLAEQELVAPADKKLVTASREDENVTRHGNSALSHEGGAEHLEDWQWRASQESNKLLFSKRRDELYSSGGEYGLGSTFGTGFHHHFPNADWEPKDPRISESALSNRANAIGVHRQSAYHEWRLHNSFVARFVASRLRKNGLDSAYSVYADTQDLPPIAKATRHEVVNLILRNVPMPKSDTPWERLVEFHEGSGRDLRRAELRHWITQAAKQELDLREAAEEIERFTLAYKRQLEKNKIESRWNAIEFTVVFPLTLLESLIPIKLSDSVKEYFEWRKRERLLLPVESSVEGEQLAYLVEVENFLAS